MNIGAFIQEAKACGFTDAQSVMLVDKFEERSSNHVTADKLTSELRGLKIELLVAGILGLAPLYAKLFGFI